MWEIEQLKKILLGKIKIQNVEYEAPYTKVFKINWNFLAKIYFYFLL